MRKLAGTLMALSLLAGPVALAGPAAAATPANETIVLTRDQNLNPSGWSATGLFTDSGPWTSDQGHFSASRSPKTGTVHLLTTEIGADGSTFRMKFEGGIDPNTGAFAGTWTIVSGTGDYANLHGGGTWERSFATDGSFVFTCPGRVHFD